MVQNCGKDSHQSALCKAAEHLQELLLVLRNDSDCAEEDDAIEQQSPCRPASSISLRPVGELCRRKCEQKLPLTDTADFGWDRSTCSSRSSSHDDGVSEVAERSARTSWRACKPSGLPKEAAQYQTAQAHAWKHDAVCTSTSAAYTENLQPSQTSLPSRATGPYSAHAAQDSCSKKSPYDAALHPQTIPRRVAPLSRPLTAPLRRKDKEALVERHCGQTEAMEQQQTVQQLRQEVQDSSTLVDMQEEEIRQLRSNLRQRDAELEFTQRKVHDLSAIIEKQREEIERLKCQSDRRVEALEEQTTLRDADLDETMDVTHLWQLLRSREREVIKLEDQVRELSHKQQATMRDDQEVMQLRSLLEQRNDDVVKLQQTTKEQIEELSQLRVLLAKQHPTLADDAELKPRRVFPGGCLEALLHPDDLPQQDDLLRHRDRLLWGRELLRRPDDAARLIVA